MDKLTDKQAKHYIVINNNSYYFLQTAEFTVDTLQLQTTVDYYYLTENEVETFLLKPCGHKVVFLEIELTHLRFPLHILYLDFIPLLWLDFRCALLLLHLLAVLPILRDHVYKNTSLHTFDRLVSTHLYPYRSLVFKRDQLKCHRQHVVFKLNEFPYIKFGVELYLLDCVLVITVLLMFFYWLVKNFQGISISDYVQKRLDIFTGEFATK